MLELFLMFLEVFPRNALELWRFEYSFIGQLLDAPNKPIQIDP